MTGVAPPPSVLVVDDNPLNLEMAELLLAADGWQVARAADAPTALDWLAGHRPDLVLMDIQLPVIDGLELTRRLRADPRTAGLVIVAFTAYVMKGDRERMLAGGCDGYIAKPIEVATFARQVRAHLRG